MGSTHKLTTRGSYSRERLKHFQQPLSAIDFVGMN